ATVEQAHSALRAGAGAAFSVDLGNAEQLVVVQELERSQLRKADPEAVCSAIRRSVAEQHELQVSAIVLLKTNSLPKTSSGKIQRFLCRSGFLDRQLDAVYTWESETLPSLSFEDSESGLEETEERLSQARASSEERQIGSAAVRDRLSDAIASPSPGAVAKAASLSSAEDIQRWMVRWLAQALQTAEATIDIRRPFAEYGLDSVTAVELADALETALGVTLEPTLAYEYPTIEALARHLARQEAPVTASVVAELAPEMGDIEVDQLVRELEMLSDAEIQALLGQQNNS
ncbi:MAG: AMP-dependent synthetase, partial [Cyanobacteria bacterium Co-bin13]|nr:AMP-dependent synthetase [Cyanobacteria bacterium Co-bin13]